MGGTLSSLPQSEVETYRACTCLDATEIDDVFEKFVELGGTRSKKDEAEYRHKGRIGHKTAKNLHAPQARGSLQAQTASVSIGPDQLQVEVGPNGAQKVSVQDVCSLPEFANNPFAPRLCQIFSANGTGNLDFDEFLDLFHVLSPKAEKDVKVLTAFRVYDFDADGYLNEEDITKLIKLTTTKPETTCVEIPPGPCKPPLRFPRSLTVASMPSRSATMPSSTMMASTDSVDEEDPAQVANAKKGKGLHPLAISDIIDHVMRVADLDGRGRLSFTEFQRLINKIPDFEEKFSVDIQD